MKKMGVVEPVNGTTRAILLIVFLILLWGILSIGIYTTTRGNAIGSDFFIFYQAGKAAAWENANPYSEEVARSVQMAVLKRPARPNEDQLGFAYPPYALFPILPLLKLNFDLAQSIWTAFLMVMLIASLLLRQPPAPLWLPFLVLAAYPVFFGTLLGNFVILLTAILILACTIIFLTHKPHPSIQVLCGILLAWSTCKPQAVGIVLTFLICAALSKKLWPLLITFGLSLAGWIGASFWLVPAWPALWLERLTSYVGYNEALPNLVFFLRTLLNQPAISLPGLWVYTGCALLTLIGLWLWYIGKLTPLTALALLAALNYLVYPRGASYTQLIFLLPMILWSAGFPRRPAADGSLVTWLTMAVLSWVGFFISQEIGVNNSLGVEIPFGVFLIWLMVLLKSKPGKHNFNFIQ